MAGRWFRLIVKEKEVIYSAFCDKCKTKRVEPEAKNLKELMEILRGTGWSVGSGTLCTECKNMMRRERYAKNR